MAKEDFCFTYYDGDAARDMAHMNRLERGGYMDLIVSQRKFGRLSLDLIKKTLGSDFENIWESIRIVLRQDAESKFFVEWVEISVEKMRRQSVKQKENGKLGGRPKANNNPNGTQLQTQTQTQKKPLEDGDGNEYEMGNVFEDLGKSENPLREDLIIPQMAEVWKTTFPAYAFNLKKDYEALGKILAFMMDQAGNHDPTNSDLQCKILNTLQLIADEVKKDNFWVNKSLVSISTHIQEFYNKIKNPVNGKAGGKSKYDDDSLKRKVLERYGKGRQGTGPAPPVQT